MNRINTGSGTMRKSAISPVIGDNWAATMIFETNGGKEVSSIELDVIQLEPRTEYDGSRKSNSAMTTKQQHDTAWCLAAIKSGAAISA